MGDSNAWVGTKMQHSRVELLETIVYTSLAAMVSDSFFCGVNTNCSLQTQSSK